MKLRSFIKTTVIAIAGVPFIDAILPKPKPKMSRMSQVEESLRIGSEVSILPKLSETEIKQIMASLCCYSTNEEMIQFFNGEEFRTKYRIVEREAAKQAQRRVERKTRLASLMT